jgi:hypothetical protein
MSKTYKNKQCKFDDDYDRYDYSKEQAKKKDNWKIERRKAVRQDNIISDKIDDDDTSY